MRKAISAGFVLVAGVTTVPVTIGTAEFESPLAQSQSPFAQYHEDPRCELLRHFFRKAECPAEAFSEEFISAADAHSLDWRLLPSISFLESGGGKAAWNNNWFGWDRGRTDFVDVPTGIRSIARFLAASVPYKGKPLDRILSIYNPEEPEYPNKVRWVMRQIAPSQWGAQERPRGEANELSSVD